MQKVPKKPVIQKVPKKPVIQKVPKKPVIQKVPKKPVVEKASRKPVVEKVNRKQVVQKVSRKPVIEERNKQKKGIFTGKSESNEDVEIEIETNALAGEDFIDYMKRIIQVVYLRKGDEISEIGSEKLSYLIYNKARYNVIYDDNTEDIINKILSSIKST
jgi:hypothetical protein